MTRTNIFLLSAAALTLTVLGASCSREYAEYDNMEVVENSYTGNIDVTSTGADPAGDFFGDGESGTYSFAWENSSKVADVRFDVTPDSGGVVQMIINDARGNEVLNETRPQGEEDTFSGLTEEGRKGTWLITINLTNVDGDGSYSINPGE